MVADSAGNLYGTTVFGGNSGCQLGCGTIYRVAANGTGTILYEFSGGADGGEPKGEIAIDKNGDLYGTTYVGGDDSCLYGCGVAFKYSPGGAMTTLYNFTQAKGSYPVSGVLMDKKGNLFGTTQQGGTNNSGTVFEIQKGGEAGESALRFRRRVRV